MDSGQSNGAAHVAHEKAASARMVLTFDPLTFHLDIGGEFPNYDCALAMLEMARRAIETEQRKLSAMQLQQQIAEQRQNAAIAQQIRGRA